MAVKKTYRINLRNYGSPPAVMVSQYDEGYAIAFEIFDGPLPVLASSLSGYTFKLKGRQPGNPPFLAYEFEGTLATALNAVVSFEIDTTMTGPAGKGTAELVILDEENDVKFASVNFAVYTEPAAVPDGSIDADVQRAMEIAEEVQEIVDTAAAEVKGEAEAWAVGERDGEPVPSTDQAYNNNAKYYSEQAAATVESISDVTDQVATNTSDISDLKEDLNAIQTATSEDVGKALKAKTVTNGKVTDWEFGEAGGGSSFDLPTATNLITILRNCVFENDVSINIDNLAEALGVNSGGDDDDDDMTFTYGQSIPKGDTARTLELTGMTIALTEIRLVVSLHSDFAQGGFCWVKAPNAGTPYVGVDANGDFYWSNSSTYSGSFSATPSDLSDFVNTIKEVKILWLNPTGFESRKYLSGFKFFFNNYNPSCGYTLYRCSGFDGSTEVFRLESSGTNGELYDVLTGTTYTFNNTTGMEIVEVSE